MGILGGTFDPVHCAHLYIAREVRRRFDLDAIHFMVSKTPPHKVRRAVTHPLHRLAMVQLALLGEEGLYASFAEVERPGPSYTVDTLEAFARNHPDSQLCFIGGGDSLNEIHLWREYGKLFREHCLVFVQRTGSEADVERLQIDPELKTRLRIVEASDRPLITPGTAYLMNLFPPSVSSTGLRYLMAQGRALPRGQVPELVCQYIRKYQIYERTEPIAE